MNTKVKANQLKDSEKGITLIALLVMVIVLIMISAVVIRGLTDDKLIDTSMTTVEEYNIASYKEQVEQAVRSIVLKNATAGRDTSIGSLAEEMAGTETIWVKSATASDENTDMLVTVVDGYVYQVYYDSTYGVVFTEYVGKDDGKGFPSLKSSYKVSIATMTVTGKAEEGEALSSIELIYKGEVINQETGKDTATFNLADVGTGWYIVKATSSSGKVRYNWVRVTNVSDRLVAPVITIKAASGDKNASGWYNETNGEVTVTIRTNSQSATKIKYWTNQDVENEDLKGEGTTSEGTLVSFTVKEGKTIVTAVEVDDEGNESASKGTAEVKVDKTRPTIIATQSPDKSKEETTGWYNEDVEVTISGEDTGSGMDGYQYMIKSEGTSISTIAQEVWVDANLEKIIQFANDGIHSVAIRTKDIAGNYSDQETVNIRLDKVAPNFGDSSIIISAIDIDKCHAHATATDTWSRKSK